MSLPEQAQPLDIRVLSKNASDLEIAAVTAVVSAALDELAATAGAEVEITAWQHSQRSLRGPLHAGPGAWRRG